MGAAPSRVDLLATMPKGELDCLRSQCELHAEEDPWRKKKSSDERRNASTNMQHNNNENVFAFLLLLLPNLLVQSACMWFSALCLEINQVRDRPQLYVFFVFFCFWLPLAHFSILFLVIFDNFSTISLSLSLFLDCFITFTFFLSTFRCLLWLVGGVVVLGVSGHGMALASDGAAGSDGKQTKVAQRPVDDGPALTLPEIQLAPVIWAKLSGYSWWPARVRRATDIDIVF